MLLLLLLLMLLLLLLLLLAITSFHFLAVVTGGPLTDKYQLAVIRFHWGHDDSSGSEHSINEQNYPLEVTHLTVNENKGFNLQILVTRTLRVISVLLFFQSTKVCRHKDSPFCLVASLAKLKKRDKNRCFLSQILNWSAVKNHLGRSLEKDQNIEERETVFTIFSYSFNIGIFKDTVSTYTI